MSAVTSKEKNLLLVAVVLVLYAAAALSFKKQVANWKAARRVYETAQKKLQDERDLIAAREEWAAKYGQMRNLMPVFPYEKDVDTHWLNIMDSAATRNGVAISRRQTSKEEEVGDVYELPIDCKDWEGSLEALVKFLYDLQQEGAMLDVRQLYVRPSNKPGYLKGSFALYCAYMRGDVAKAPAQTAPAQAAAGAPAAAAEEAAAEPPAAPGAEAAPAAEVVPAGASAAEPPPAETAPGAEAPPAPPAPPAP